MADALVGVAFAPQIAAAAARHHLDPRLLAAVAAQETGGPGSTSGANIVGDGGHGHGLFQIDDRWHAFARTASAMDPAHNADYAAGMLEDGVRRYGDMRAALSAYNAGSPTARGSETTWADGRKLGYADSVLRHYAELGGEPGTSAGEPTAELPYQSAELGALGNFAFSIPPIHHPSSQQPPDPSYDGLINFAGDGDGDDAG